jgi:DNA-directed RNA polymerase specialized sigma24 family protein
LALAQCEVDHAHPSGEPEYDYGRYAERIRLTVSRCLDWLPPTARTLLYQRYVLGASLEAIGSTQSLHKVTVARRLARARHQLRELVTSRLCDEFPRISEEDLRYLVALMCAR